MSHNPRVSPPLLGAGSTVPVERKWEIYSICSEYGVVIIEDDPYYYLQYPDAAGAAACVTSVQHVDHAFSRILYACARAAILIRSHGFKSSMC
jgi:DNA-binding transcriptional MocR family regulator